MSLNLFRKKTAQEIEDQKEIDKLRHDAELKVRKELAIEHGKADAERKYGKFKQPSIFEKIGAAASRMATAGESAEEEPKKKKRKGGGWDEAMKKLEELCI